MGNRKNFVASVKSKIARALAKLFPAYAVRKKTLLTNPNANDWIVADVDQAMYLIKKLKFSEREIAERTWSSATRMELLSKSDSKGRKALANTVRNENELEAILRYGDVEDMVAAIKSFTPSAKRMREFVSSVSTPVGLLNKIAEEAPTAFKALTAKEILGITPNQKCNKASDKRWDLALDLMGSAPEWCPKFMLLIREIPPRQLTDVEIAYFKDIFAIAKDAKVSLAGLLSYMCVFFREEYILYVNAFKAYPTFAMEFKEMFPQYVKYLKDGADHYTSLVMLSPHINENYIQKDEAYAWLAIGRDILNKNPEAFSVFLENIDVIYAANSKLGKELIDKMTEEATSVDDLIALQQKMGDIVDNNKFNEKVYSIILAKSKFYGYADAPNYLKFFPFTDWKVENARHAVKRIVLCNKLPVDRVGELSEELQQYVLQTMEAQSQLSALCDGKVDELVKLQLYPVVEIELFYKKYHSCKEQILDYINSFGMSQEAYEAIIRREDVRESFVDFLTKYAEKWGLTQKQYVQLLQSRGIGLAPFLKQYVGKKPEVN